MNKEALATNTTLPLLPPGNLPRVDHDTTVPFTLHPTNGDLIEQLTVITKMVHVPIWEELRYTLLRTIDSGGQADVWQAVDLSTGRFCAIKKLKPELQTNSAYTGHFYQEALGLRYRHKKAVPVTDFFILNDNFYLVMPYIEYPRVDDLIDSNNLKLTDIKEIIVGATEVLDYTASFGLINRDPKPSNMFYDPDTKQFLMIDFGLTRVKNLPAVEPDGTFSGTVSYATKEDIEGDPVERESRTICRLGTILFELLTGETMYARSTMAKTFDTIVNPTKTHLRIKALQSALTGRFHVSYPEIPEQKIQSTYNKTILTDFHKFHPLVRVILKATFLSHDVRYQTLKAFQEATIEAMQKAETDWVPEDISFPGLRREKNSTVIFRPATFSGASD